MWESLDRIEWAELRHHRGKATDFPRLLRDCAGDSPVPAEAAIHDLDDALTAHTGGWISPAAVAALPYLTDLAAGAARHHRDLVIDLVDRLLFDGADPQTRVSRGRRRGRSAAADDPGRSGGGHPQDGPGDDPRRLPAA
ncbi:hypothetical protein [Actinoplanes sp. G11-F43]|uniref:hypothetical protein n=1 Tax=Actinoplanes sp. G11-F43 TaxID=3424130 RepID=UPI003D35050E